MLSGQNSAEQQIAHPLLNDLDILQSRPLKYVEVGIPEDYCGGCDGPQSVKQREFLLVLVRYTRRK